MKIAIPTILHRSGVAMSALLLACTLGPKTSPDDTGAVTDGSSGGGGPTSTGGSEPPNPTGAGPTSADPTSGGPTSDTPPPDPTTSADTAVDSGDFIVRFDAGVVDPCDLGAQDCGEGQKCNPAAGRGGSSIFQGTPLCVPLVPDAKPPGAPCSVFGDWLDGTDDCEQGSVCLWPDDQGIGQCHALCNIQTEDPPDPSCPPGDSCFGLACQTCFWGYCDQPCDPRELSSCEAGEVCQDSVGTWFCLPDASGDAGQDGDPCEFVNSCDPGLFCAFAETLPDCDGQASGCCTPFCSTDQANTCPGKDQGEVCVPWYAEGQAPPQLATLGLCTLPP